jgi:hypothetical protein
MQTVARSIEQTETEARNALTLAQSLNGRAAELDSAVEALLQVTKADLEGVRAFADVSRRLSA